MVAGLQDGKPIIATYDSIGCMNKAEPIEVGGTAWEMLLGAAETFYQKDMDEDQLMECTAQVLTAGVDRDASSGWGGLVYVL